MTARWQSSSDGALLRAAGNDPDAFDAFYRRYEALVAGWILRAVGDPEVTADLAAETFARALTKRSTFRDGGGDPAAGWLLAIATNLIRHYRRRDAVADRAIRRLGMERPTWSDSTLTRLVRLADQQEWAAELEAALAALPASQRAAVLAHVADGASYAELAEQQGTTEANVRQRVSRGLARLRAVMTPPEG